ncbi:uncharacterized protein LOC114740307 [Neltuma alba]|uniref:uncharacterized protein LOC114740307 n=1 Tax=Neltuma alba TaxID=207710 RepID=UPI0010A2FE39|nr:uncharacterized protein LOC114740307 [Prosopis alba]
MIFITWNCQGLGASLAVRNLKEVCTKYRPSLVFLMETKKHQSYLKRIKKKLGFHSEFYMDPRGRSGGLAVWWMDELQIDLISGSSNIIHARISCTSEDAPYFLTLVYGPPKEAERSRVWDRLASLATSINGSWLCAGDFNEILNQNEKMGGNPRAARKILRFHKMISDCEFLDLEFKGSRFTWANGRIGVNNIKERIDRVFGNGEMREKFPKAMHEEYDGVVCRSWNSDKYQNSNVADEVAAKLMLTEEILIQKEAISREMEEAISYVDCKITEADNMRLMRAVAKEEVKAACFQMGGRKAPSPDGFIGQFYHCSWETVGDKIFELVKNCVENGLLIDPVNTTDLVMIPKTDKPEVALRKNCRRLKKIFAVYGNASGQLVNLEKSRIYFSANTDEKRRNRVCRWLEIKETRDPGKYLGLPIIWSKSKAESLAFNREKMIKKIQGWK